MLFVFLLLTVGAQDARAVLDQAITDFRAGRIEQSLAGFDRVATMSPGGAPYLWLPLCVFTRR